MKRHQKLAAILFLGLFGLLIVFPLLSLWGWGGESAQSSIPFLDQSLLRTLRMTLYQAGLSALFSLLIGMPVGLQLGSSIPLRSRWSRWVEFCLSIPFILPTVVVASVFLSWFGNSGLLASWGVGFDLAYSLEAVIFVHVWMNAPWIALLVMRARQLIPQTQIEISRSLGAHILHTFQLIIWPQIRGAAGSGALQVFGLCATSFALVLLLGGGPPVQTLETWIYAKIRFSEPEYGPAVAAALWQLMIGLVPWTLFVAYEIKKRNQRPGVATIKLDPSAQMKKSGFLSGLIPFVFLFPLVSVFIPSTIRPALEETFWAEVLPSFVTSLQLALIASFGSLILAILALLSGRSFWIILLTAVPAGISTLALCLGFWLAYENWVDPFSGSRLAIGALQSILFFPFVYRTLWPIAQENQRELNEAARSLGASAWFRFRLIEWPKWREPALRVALMVAVFSFGEIAAVSFFYSDDLIPVSLLMSRWLGQYRFEQAQTLSLLMLLISCFTVAAVGLFPKENA